MKFPKKSSADSRRALWKWVLRLALGLFILVLVLRQRETLERLLVALRAVPPWVVVASIAFYLLGQWVCAWKWRILLCSRGFEIGVGRCFSIYLAGMFANLFLPTNIGGDALRVARMSRENPRNEHEIGAPIAFASVLLDRLTGFVALLFLALCGLLTRGAQGDGSRIVLFSLGAFMLVGFGLWAIFQLPHPKIVSVRAALAQYKSKRGTIVITVVLSLVFQASQIVLNIALARAVGLHVSPLELVWIAPVLSLSGLLPLGIGGLGTREVAALALLRPFGEANGAIVAWSLLWQVCVWGASLPGLFFMRAGKRE